MKQGSSVLDAEILDIYDDEDLDRGFDEEILVLQGEVRRVLIRITNRGAEPVDQIWLTVDDSVLVWANDDDGFISKSITAPFPLCLYSPSFLDGFFSPTTSDDTEEIPFVNELQWVTPISLPLEKLCGVSSLAAGHSFEASLYIRAEGDTPTHLRALLTYCKARNDTMLPGVKVLNDSLSRKVAQFFSQDWYVQSR